MNGFDATVTVREALRRGRELLASSGTAALDAQLLLARVLGQTRGWVLAHDDIVLEPNALARYDEFLVERARGVPVAYLRGRVEWFGMALTVSPAVLIPRPDTEVLVETAAELAGRLAARTLVDVGTGSGAIAIALARLRPEATIVASDLSSAALEIAGYNAVEHGVARQIEFRRGSLLDPIVECPDLIVANLPYLSDGMMATSPRDVRHEPPGALHGGATGLELYEAMFKQMIERRWAVTMVIEFDPRQTAPLARMVAAALPGWSLVVRQDLAGRDRVGLLEPGS